MNRAIGTVWLVTREYAGIAEAGGVKNVACSLAEGLVRQGCSTAVFIPRYGCVVQEGNFLFSCGIEVAGDSYGVSFSSLVIRGVTVVFVESPVYREKRAVYTYTAAEERAVSGVVRGKGHSDVDILNMILQKAVIAYALHTGTVPDALHCQDAHTALLPALIRTVPDYDRLFAGTAFLVTIHNAGPGYRQAMPGLLRAKKLTGLPDAILERALLNGNVEPFLLAAEFARLTTVSPWYAEELTSANYDQDTEGLSGEFERRRISVAGITNGIDFDRYDPRDTSCSLLPHAFDPEGGTLAGKYRCRKEFFRRIRDGSLGGDVLCHGSIDADPHAVYFSYHGRIAWQKGLDVLAKSAQLVLDHVSEARFVVLGQGDPVLEANLVRMSARYNGRFVFLNGYERSLARMAVATSDFLVLPSMFEPCGLEDYIGQIYGTIPVAHAVGGLKKIEDGRNGFLYATNKNGNDIGELSRILIDLATEITASGSEGAAGIPRFMEMIRYGAKRVREVCNWDTIIEREYLPLYRKNLPGTS